jgi:hypothetical protein
MEARRKYAEYRTAVESGRGDRQDRELMHAYHQLGLGRTVVSLGKAIRTAGTDAVGRPILAVANASARWCFFVWAAGEYRSSDWSHPASAFVSSYQENPGWRTVSANRATWRGAFRFPREWFGFRLQNDIRAQVPSVPVKHRPKARLDNYVILWEANWEEAPRDPYLLRRVTGDLFVVLAQWNLTDVERTVLEMSTISGCQPAIVGRTQESRTWEV